MREPAAPRRDAALRHYLTKSVAAAGAELATPQPVVVMVHGFLFDLKQAVSAELLPNHPIDLVCHSLGSRVVVRAIALAAKHDRRRLLERLGQVIILGGAEYVGETQLMQRRLDDLNLTSRPAFYNFVSRENDVLDKLAENFGRACRPAHFLAR